MGLYGQSGIYMIQNIVNVKRYVGSARDLGKRRNIHFSELRRNCHSNPHLQNAFNKYGQESFVFKMIELCDEATLLVREQFYLDAYDVVENGYNINPNAGSNLGRKFSQEARGRMAAAKLGKKRGHHAEKVKQKISESLKGKKHSLGRRNNNSLSRGHPFICIENGVRYINQAEAARRLGVKHRSLNAVLNGHRKSTGGFHFAFID